MKKFSKILLFIGILLTLYNQSTAMDVECKYRFGVWRAVGQIYGCFVQNKLNITSPDNDTITSVTGIHKQGKSNNDVKGFRCRNCNIEYFPKGLENIFPNLKGISFYDNKIKEVHQSDLKPFPNVELLTFYGNFIEVIEEDLFKFNRKLKAVSFSRNPIVHIHPNVFDDLNELSYLLLKSLSCMDKYADGNSTAVKEVIKVIKSKCNENNYSKLDGKFKNFEIHHNSLDSAEFN